MTVLNTKHGLMSTTIFNSTRHFFITTIVNLPHKHIFYVFYLKFNKEEEFHEKLLKLSSDPKVNVYCNALDK